MDEPLIGSIFIWPLSWVPQDFLLCNGASVPVGQYQKLFSLIGFAYGGNGTTMFNLPDLRGRFPSGLIIKNPGLGKTGGQETVKLTTNNVPRHTHPATFTPTRSKSELFTIHHGLDSGAITASASIDVTPGNAGTLPANGTNTYYLTGGKIGNNNIGGFTTTAPSSGNTAGVTGIKVAVNSADYRPNIPERKASPKTVTGGHVLVGPNTNPNKPFDIVPPYLELNFIIAFDGTYSPPPK